MRVYPMELVDRDIPLQELNTAWHHAAIQEGCAVLIYGEAGIGKTALVEQFVHQQKKPIRLLWGACDALFTPRPLGPLHDIAAQTQGSLSQLLQAEATPSMIFAACLHELQSQPTIVVVEDIHWADEATLDLLKYLGRRIHLTHSLLIVTYRDDALNPQHLLRLLLGDLATSAAVHHLALTPLSTAAVGKLAFTRLFFQTALPASAARGFSISSCLIFSPSSIAHTRSMPEGPIHENNAITVAAKNIDLIRILTIITSLF
jgi:predicted ATPase